MLVKRVFHGKHFYGSMKSLGMVFDVLGRRHLVAVLESTIESAQTFEPNSQGNIQHGHITFNQQQRRLPSV